MRSHLGVQYTLRVSAKTRVSWCRRNGRGQYLPARKRLPAGDETRCSFVFGGSVAGETPEVVSSNTARQRSACLPAAAAPERLPRNDLVRRLRYGRSAPFQLPFRIVILFLRYTNILTYLLTSVTLFVFRRPRCRCSRWPKTTILGKF